MTHDDTTGVMSAEMSRIIRFGCRFLARWPKSN